MISDRAVLNGSAAVAYEIKYRIMGSNAHLWALTPDPEPLSRAAVLLGDLQSLWSRFEPESETNRLNTGWANARSIDISEPTVGLLLRMETAWWMTGGRWDPTVLGSVFAGGYVHSLETGAPAPTHGLPAQFAAAPGLGGVEVSTSPPSVYLPAGVAIDPGGMAKGYAADLAVQCLMDYGCAAARVNLGGDIACGGTPIDGRFDVVVADPFAPVSPRPMGSRAFVEDEIPPIAALSIPGDGMARGVATSTTRARRGAAEHRVIDPMSGEPIATDLVSATVVAASCWEAEVWATACLVAGSSEAQVLMAERGLTAVLIDLDGNVWQSDAEGFRPVRSGQDVEVSS